jgi:hypothetical protein
LRKFALYNSETGFRRLLNDKNLDGQEYIGLLYNSCKIGNQDEGDVVQLRNILGKAI